MKIFSKIKRTYRTILILLWIPVSLFSQEITEENYLKVDKEIWKIYDQDMGKVYEAYSNYPDKKDSISLVASNIYELARKKNIKAAIKYASVPSGLQRLFMLRLYISKDTLLSILESLPQNMQSSDYSKSILLHINSEQIEENDKYYDFKATDSNGNTFQLSSLIGSNIFLLYGGLGCMGQEGRDYLMNLHKATSLKVVIYWSCSNLEELKNLKAKYPYDYIFVSDFLIDHTPVKIIYGAQATPTCFLIDEKGTVIIKSVGLPEDRLTKLQEEKKL